ncbi:hypothetical protein GGD81_001381 [Rhodobium orientis]|uniref:Baseplate assembly protein n=1 Tax=Rhodobium orientis TaxID=34017 RepID=A0A327JMQ1_9HYPH|nr:baseplate assembly protein [Rhodobium orientis]MBB4302354.1 hypothetical protein [Rhodobium orientis]MBK5949059.1 baseplate assembly protein [Rhodobium orientis]RAI26614.1 baseplate assembly protein [Rhodobium orientis]
MARTGINAETGKLLVGWPHCEQSIRKILSTRFNTRTRYRHLGSDVPDLQDQNATDHTLLKLYTAVHAAIDDETDGEPGFDLTSIEMIEYGRAGRFAFMLDGIYYPNGHLGDFSIAEDRRAVIPVSTTARLDLVEVGS